MLVRFAAAFTAAHGMVDRVHDHAPDMGTSAEPAGLARFPAGKVLMVLVPYLPDGGHAFEKGQAEFTAWKPDKGLFPFLGHQLS